MTTFSNIKHNSLKKWLFLPIGIAFFNIGSATKPVQALTFQQTTQGILEFRDATNQIVATGTFSYSPTPLEGTFAIGEVLELITDPDGNEYYLPTGEFDAIFYSDPSEKPDNLFITDEIFIDASQDLRPTSINITSNITGNNYDLDTLFPYNVYLFKPPASEFTSSGLSQVLVTASPFGELNLSFQDYWIYGDGFPDQAIISSDGDYLFSLPGDFSSGTWQAQAVPEPLTLLGTSAALSFGVFFKRKLSKNNKTKI